MTHLAVEFEYVERQGSLGSYQEYMSTVDVCISLVSFHCKYST